MIRNYAHPRGFLTCQKGYRTVSRKTWMSELLPPDLEISMEPFLMGLEVSFFGGGGGGLGDFCVLVWNFIFLFFYFFFVPTGLGPSDLSFFLSVWS